MISPNQPIASLYHFMLSIISPYKKLVTAMALVGLIWAFTNTFTPFILKLIIDHVVSASGNKLHLFKSTLPYVLGYIALWIVLCVNMRFLDWVKLKLFPSIREDVMSKMFNYLTKHSYQYFQNNFSGSLVNKIGDMQSGIIGIFTTLDDLYAQAVSG